MGKIHAVQTRTYEENQLASRSIKVVRIRRDLDGFVWQRSLDKGCGVQLDHGVFAQVVQDFVEVAMVVVDDDPTASPARQNVDLADGASRENRHVLGEVGN